MRALSAFFLLSLLFFVSIKHSLTSPLQVSSHPYRFHQISNYLGDARKDPAEYWRSTMKGEPIPDAIEQLFVDQDPSSEAISAEHRFSKDFDTVPNAIIYHRAGPKKPKLFVRSSGRPEHGAERGGERLVSDKPMVKVPEYNKAQRELIYRRYIAIPD